MAERVHVLTPEGRQKLEQELEHLSTVRRREVARRLKSAIEDGDITENAGYDEAKREQSFVEGRIQEIEAVLSNAQVLEETTQRDRVSLGSRVTVREEGEEPETYHIVGAVEADPLQGRISYESPLGKALVGRVPGDRVQVNTPGGVVYYLLVSIE